MDITIQNVRSPALEHNGRYYKVFQPRSRDELLKLHHMGCVGDTVLTDIQIEQGDFPTNFVEPTITQRSLSGLFKDMRNIELELRDPNSTLWGKIQQNNQGALSQFFDRDVKSAIAQTANEIRQEVRNSISDTSRDSNNALSRAKEELRSAISQTAGEIRQEIRSSSNASNSELSKAKDELRRETTTAITQTADAIRQEVRTTVSSSNSAIDKVKEELTSSLSQTASEIRQEVREAGKGASVSVTSKGVTIGATTLTGKQLASVISTSQDGIDLIAPKIRVQSDMIVDGSITGSKMAAGSVTAEHIAAGAISGDDITVTDALIRNLTAKDGLIEKLTSKEIFSTKVSSVLNSSTFLEAYKGWIGGFQIGTHDSGTGKWITGKNHFNVGMGDGEGGDKRTALWVNWGDNWDKVGNTAWFVKNNGEMNCYNTAHFWNTPVVHGDLRVTGSIYYNNEASGGRAGRWVYSETYSNIEPDNGYLYLYYSGSGHDWIPMNQEISDRRYKTNIEDSKVSGLEVINNLKTYSYRKEYGGKIEDISCGIMAQDVQKYAPEAFWENPDGVYSYKVFELVPYLIKAIQELNQKIGGS